MLKIKDVSINERVLHTPSNREGVVISKNYMKDTLQVQIDDKIIDVKCRYFSKIVSLKSNKISNKEKAISVNRIYTLFDNEGLKQNIIIPQNFSSYPNYVKDLLYFLKTKKNDCQICIRNVKEYNGYIGIIINLDKGVIVFKIFDVQYNITELQDSSFYDFCCEEQNKLIGLVKQNFLKSDILTDLEYGKQLIFPYKTMLVFQNIDLEDFDLLELTKIQLYKNVCFKNFTSSEYNIKLFEKYYYQPNEFNRMSRNIIPNLIERIAPEYTTVPSFKALSVNHNYFKSIQLDENQINIINNIKPGIRLFLANPGTSKSVI